MIYLKWYIKGKSCLFFCPMSRKGKVLGEGNLSGTLRGEQDWAPFSLRWALADSAYFHGIPSATKRWAGSYCRALFCRNKKIQWSNITYKTVSTDCTPDVQCTLPEERPMLLLLNSFAAILQGSLEWAVKTTLKWIRKQAGKSLATRIFWSKW